MDEVILGMDFMAKHGFVLNVERQVLQYANVTLPVTMGYNRHSEISHIAVQRQQGSSKKRRSAQPGNRLQEEARLRKHIWLNGTASSSKMGENASTTKKLLVVPQAETREIIREYHNGSSGEHLGITRIVEKIKQNFYWVGIKDSASAWIRSCDQCSKSKDLKSKPHTVAYRSPVHNTTALPLAKILFGINLRLPADLKFGMPPNVQRAETEYVARMGAIVSVAGLTM
uniref:Integrase_H2C2 domain-containing protein n=1 Tax=Glossina austeni TaxID=7395 RepID=A0A1A9V208_GLOAU